MKITKAETMTTQPVEVVQADREAAAEMWAALKGVAPMPDAAEWQVEWMREGTADLGPVVQAFALHRLAGKREGIEAAAKAVQATLDTWERLVSAGVAGSLDALLAALRTLAHQQGDKP
jgi:hypothetical protein